MQIACTCTYIVMRRSFTLCICIKAIVKSTQLVSSGFDKNAATQRMFRMFVGEKEFQQNLMSFLDDDKYAFWLIECSDRFSSCKYSASAPDTASPKDALKLVDRWVN